MKQDQGKFAQDFIRQLRQGLTLAKSAKARIKVRNAKIKENKNEGQD